MRIVAREYGGRLRRRIAKLSVGIGITMVIASTLHAAELDHEPLGDGTELIVLTGDIEKGDDEAFRSLSVKFKSAIVALNSKGGALLPAIEIGKMIRLTGYETLVPSESLCTSSCALIWLAGSSRWLSPKGRVGFHASYMDNNGRLEETGVGNAIVGHYLSLLNLPQKAVIFATVAAPNEIMWLSDNNKTSSGIDFRSFPDEDDEPRTTATSSSGRRPTSTAVVTTPPPVFTPQPVQGVPVVTAPPPIPVVHTQVAAKSSSKTPTGRDKLPSLPVFTLQLKSAVRSPNFVNAMIQKLGPGIDHPQVVRAHVNTLYQNDSLLEKLAAEVYKSREEIEKSPDPMAMSRTLGEAFTQRTTLSGLGRLSNDDIKKYIQYLEAVTLHLNDTECHAVFAGNGSTGPLELKAISKLGSEELARFFALQRKAIQAELDDRPILLPVPKHQLDVAKEAFDTKLLEYMRELSSAESQRITAAWNDQSSANAKDLCDANYVVFKIMNEMTGYPGDWFRRDFVQSLALQ